MKKSVKRKRTLKVVCFFLSAALLLAAAEHILHVTVASEASRIRSFYMEPEDSLDVVFIGASEVYSGFAPGLAWDAHHFTSYLYSVAAGPISMVKYELIEVLKHQNPKVILIEINGALSPKGEYQTREKGIRPFLDNIPWSENRLEAIRNVIPEDGRMSYYFPFLKYHSAWKNWRIILKNMAEEGLRLYRDGSQLRGAKTVTKTDRRADLIDASGETESEPLNAEAERYLRDLLEYLRENGIKNVLFYRTPHNLTEKGRASLRRVNRAEEILAEYGYPFINFELEKKEIGIDPRTDYYSPDHLNIYGQIKFTRYLADYLARCYDLEDMPHTEAERASWDKTAEATLRWAEYARELEQRGVRKELCDTWELMQWMDKK